MSIYADFLEFKRGILDCVRSDLNSGNGKFNDKPMIAVDTNPGSPHLNTVYVAWDNASPRNGKSSDNDVVLVSSSTDHGLTFSAPVAASPSQGGPAAVIGADPFVGPDGTLFVAWQDSINPAIRESSSSDGGSTFGPAHLIANTLAVFQVNPPAQALRGALIYPACGADASAGFHGRLYCSWNLRHSRPRDFGPAGRTRLARAASGQSAR